MKTMKTIFVVAITALAINVAMASGNLKVNLASNDIQSAVVEISNTNMVNYEIQLFDQSWRSLYSMKTEVPRKELTKRYNFSNLEDGSYWYIVKIDNEEVTKRLEIDNGKVKVTDIRKTVEPYIHQDGDMIKLSFLNFENEDIKLYVYDKNKTLLAEADLGNSFTIHKGINLSNLNPGSYELVLTNDYDIFQHSLELN